MKDHLNHLWNQTDLISAKAWFHQWISLARESGITALVTFARNLSAHAEGLLSYVKYPMTTGVIEGMNNTIKVIKRVAYGFRDDEYFFLRIRHAFPGIPR